jgi:translation initiation factor 2 subunit 1
MADEPTQEKQLQPKHGELVIAIVAKITKYGSYCKLPEYNNIEVFLPLREISSGWIKNIHGFLREGQNTVGKVILIDKEKKTIDISLKRVMPKEAKEKTGQYNLEKKLEALFTQKAKPSAKNDQPYQQLAQTIRSEFGTYVNFAINGLKRTPQFQQSKVPEELRKQFVDAIEAARKSRKFFVSYTLTLSTTDSVSGVARMKEIIENIEKRGVEAKYMSAPKYSLKAEGTDYADAEKKIRDSETMIKSKINKTFTFSIDKDKLKKEREGLLEQYLS